MAAEAADGVDGPTANGEVHDEAGPGNHAAKSKADKRKDKKKKQKQNKQQRRYTGYLLSSATPCPFWAPLAQMMVAPCRKQQEEQGKQEADTSKSKVGYLSYASVTASMAELLRVCRHPQHCILHVIIWACSCLI